MREKFFFLCFQALSLISQLDLSCYIYLFFSTRPGTLNKAVSFDPDQDQTLVSYGFCFFNCAIICADVHGCLIVHGIYMSSFLPCYNKTAD